MGRIATVDELRQHYGAPTSRSLGKEVDHLDDYCRQFIALAPFVMIGSQGVDGHADASPRGEDPGFVAILDEHHLAIPDRPGNNRLDTMSNIIENPAVGLLFLVPGFRELLRVNGRAEIRTDDDLRKRFAINDRLPATVIVVEVESAFLHCSKAMMRSRLWEQDAQPPRETMPTLGIMLRDQMGAEGPVETEEEMLEGFRKVLY